MIRQRLTAAMIMLMLFIVARPQNGGKDYTDEGAYRVARCEKYCSYPAPLGEAVLSANNLFQKDSPGGSKMLVRVCSKEPLPIAIATASIEPDDVVRLTRGFASDNFKTRIEGVIAGRSEDCSAKSSNVTSAELWAVPENVPMPPVVESVKACQIRTRFITTDGNEYADIRPREATRFRRSVNRLVAELKADPQATGFVLGYYLNNQTKLMRARLQKAEQLLAKSGLPAARYIVRPIPQRGYDATEASADYLNVKTVRLNSECSSPQKQREVLIAK